MHGGNLPPVGGPPQPDADEAHYNLAAEQLVPARLRACARVTIRRLSGARLRDRNFSFFGAVQDFEVTIIEQALEEEGGSVTRAAKLLGLKHQTFITMLNGRHKKLLKKRTPREKRLKSIIKEPKE